MIVLLIVYMFTMVCFGFTGTISWQLIIASAMPDGVAIYFAVVALELSNNLEARNGMTMKRLVETNEDILTYVQNTNIYEQDS